MKKVLASLLLIVILTSCTTVIKTEKPQTFSFSTAARSSEPGTFSFDIPIVLKLNSIKTELENNFSSDNIKINDVQIYGANSSTLVIGLNIEATKCFLFKVKGWIYVKGTPDLDVEKQTFRIKDIQLDSNTEQVLVKSAIWIVNPILKVVSNGVKIDIQKIVDKQKEKFKTIELKDYGQIDLDIHEFVIKEIDITNDELEIRVKASGNISTKVDIK